MSLSLPWQCSHSHNAIAVCVSCEIVWDMLISRVLCMCPCLKLFLTLVLQCMSQLLAQGTFCRIRTYSVMWPDTPSRQMYSIICITSLNTLYNLCMKLWRLHNVHNALLDVARTMTDTMLLGQEVAIYCSVGCTVEPLYNKQGYLSNEGTACCPNYVHRDVYIQNCL